tara:strand:+ start:423 stop:710 length:288 start_codon:yes stop_codon:yes gene_type:complete
VAFDRKWNLETHYKSQKHIKNLKKTNDEQDISLLSMIIELQQEMSKIKEKIAKQEKITKELQNKEEIKCVEQETKCVEDDKYLDEFVEFLDNVMQ